MNEVRCIPSTSLDPPPEPVMDPCCLRCQECGETKSNPNTLFYHLFEYHNYDKARIARIREQRKTRSLHIKAVRQTRPLYLCNICGKQFLSKSGIITHSESIHKLTRDPPAGIHCPISSCAGRFYTYMELATHADVEHRNEVLDRNAFRVYRKQFPDIFSFQEWRMQKELESDSKFVMRGSETKFTYGKRIAMWHCAEGHSRRKFALHKPCPAFIKVCERHDGTFDVVACFGHLGHPHLSLRAPTACTVRLGAIEGVEKIVAMQDVIEVSEDFLESEESGNYQVMDVNAEVESGSLVE